MDYLNYFGVEGLLSLAVDGLAFVVFVGIYLLTRKSEVGHWTKYFHYSMGFMALSYLLPFFVGWSSAFGIGSLPEKYYGVVYLLSYSIPLVLAVVCFIATYKVGRQSA